MPERVQLSEVLLRLEAELRRKAADGCSLPAGSQLTTALMGARSGALHDGSSRYPA